MTGETMDQGCSRVEQIGPGMYDWGDNGPGMYQS